MPSQFKSATAKSQKSTKPQLKRIFIPTVVVLAILLIPGFALAYTGFLPGGTELLGTNKPIDLGVRYTSTDLATLQGKLNMAISSSHNGVLKRNNYYPDGSGPTVALDPGAKLLVDSTGPWTNGTKSFSSAELTALFNDVPWGRSPIKNSQIKIDSGTLEFSGNVSAAYVVDLLHTIDPSGNNSSLSPVLRLASHLHNPAVYMKLALSFTPADGYQATAKSFGDGSDPYGYDNNGTLHFTVEDVKVNRTDVSDYLEGHTDTFDAHVGQGVKVGNQRYSLWWLALQDGQLQFDGDFPQGLYLTDDAASQWCKEFKISYLKVATLTTVDGRIAAESQSCNN